MMKNMRLRKGEVDACSGERGDSSPLAYDSDKRSKKSSVMRRNMLPILPLLALSATYGLLLRPTTNIVPVERLQPVRENLRKRVLGEKECGIWLAPSSLKGHPGFGIYTTRDIAKTESILAGQDGPSVAIVDYIGNPNKDIKRQWIKVWDNYWWARGVADSVNYEADEVIDFQIGFGANPNHHCVLDSLNIRYPNPAYDDSLVNRYRDPGAGAFSYHTGREFFVDRDVKAGEELFLNYGHCQREGSSDSADWSTTIPMVEDYHMAAKILWDALTKPGTHSVPKNVNKYVTSLLHSSARDELMAVLKSGKVKSHRDFVPFVAKHLATNPRTPEWIKSNGMCLEHLLAGKSQIPQAGQGAIVQRKIRKGEIVVPVPLLQVVDKEALDMHDDDGNLEGSQLLVNYCFGHPESSMLLCPDTNALLINHCSDRKKECGSRGPNVGYRWSTGWEPSSETWLKMTIEEIAEELVRGVSMEIVALRDLEPGEEVFMDYGVEWEEAWEKHVANWKPPAKESGDFVSAKEANEQGNSLNLLVTGDLRKEPDHPYLFTGCQFWPTKHDTSKVYTSPSPAWWAMEDERILSQFSSDGSWLKGNYTTHEDRSHWPCSVIREDEDGSYIVRIHQANWSDQQPWDKNDTPRFLTKYPREGIHYFVKPYEGDQYLPGVFRHPIGLRDEIFPAQWKNRKQAI